jgi:hypothetical protein
MLPARADMYPDASNAKLPDARTNLAIAPHVATNAALIAASTATYPSGVWRDDFATGNGTPPLWYKPSGSACSLAAGNGDNGSQVKSADSKCWLAVFPSVGRDLLQFGGGPLAADNLAPLLAALASLPATNVGTSGGVNGGCVLLPPGKLTFSAAASFTYPTLTGTGARYIACIKGSAGNSGTFLYWPAAAGGLTFTLNSQSDGIDLEDFTLTTGQAGGGTALTINQTVPGGPFSDYALLNLSARGDTSTANYWTLGYSLTGMTLINATNLTAIGNAAGTAGDGILYQGTAAPANAFGLSLVNFNGTTLRRCLTYGNYVQGVTLTSGGCYNGTTGIYVAPGTLGVLAGLFLSNFQFGVTGNSMDIETAVDQIVMQGGIAYTNTNGITAFNFPKWAGGSIVGVAIAAGNGATGTTGISINGGSTIPGTITGNQFFGLGTAISYGATAANIAESGNAFQGNTTNVTFASGASVLLGGTNIDFFNAVVAYLGAGTTGYFLGSGLSTSELAVARLPALTGYLQNLRCVGDQAPGTSQSYTFTARLGGTPQALVAVMAGASNNAIDTNLAHSFQTTAAGVLTLGISSSATAAAGTHFNCSAWLASNP